MIKLISFLTVLLFSFSALSQTMPMNKAEYCQRFNEDNRISERLLELTQNTENLISFKNNGGLFNAGVCWWHSRFQRNLLYLGKLNPLLPRPKKNEVKPLIREIRQGLNIVMIPGFKSIEEFTSAYKNDIQDELNDWQLFDGIVLSAWINGIKGTHTTTAIKLKKIMDNLYKTVGENKKIAYQKLQIKGITAHAWLVVGMKKNDNGYSIGVVDSNDPQMTKSFNYVFGNTSFHTKGYGHFVPYTEFTREELRLETVAKQYCDIDARSFTYIENVINEDLDIIEHNKINF